MEPKTKKILIVGIALLAMIGFGAILVYDHFKYGELKTLSSHDKKAMSYQGESLLLIKPTFTETAYSPNGFYKYFNGKCNESCLQINIQKGNPTAFLAWNMKGINIMQKLGYPMIDDLELHKKLAKDPDFLQKYDSIILMHNEYVTREMFEAVTAHKNVIYLYPNTLYAQVQYQYSFGDEKIRLVQGHGYPNATVDNGFGWKHDNTRPYEFDRECKDWFFNRIENGWQLNCYPELVLTKKPEILKTVKLLVNNEEFMK